MPSSPTVICLCARIKNSQLVLKKEPNSEEKCIHRVREGQRTEDLIYYHLENTNPTKPLLAPLNIFAQGKAEVRISVLEVSDCQTGAGYQTGPRSMLKFISLFLITKRIHVHCTKFETRKA